MVNILNYTSLEKTDFPFGNRHQLCPLSAGILSGLNQCRSCVCYHSILSSYVHQFCYVWNILSPWCHLSPLTFTIFLSPFLHFLRFLNLESRDLINQSYVGLNLPKSLLLCMLSCGSLETSNARNSFSDVG